jgi:superfamily II DNA/RNA helicase
VGTGLSNKLAGQIGEYRVCAELGRRGLIATPFSGNVPTFDVLATDEQCRTVTIQVKALRGTNWPSDTSRQGGLPASHLARSPSTSRNRCLDYFHPAQELSLLAATPSCSAKTDGDKHHLNIAPGARILVRSEEWLVRTFEPSTDGGRLIVCEGISELVRGVEAHFLTKLEDEIQVLDPAATTLVADDSPQFLASLLYIESLRLRSTPNDTHIRLAHQGVMKSKPYQFDPARIALRQPRPRILIADGVGLGKTLEAGIVATELIRRGRGKRILVITLKSMLTQFQKEWWSRFSIPLLRLDSVGLARVRDRIPANHNPFNYYEKTIISMDTLKNNLEYRNYLEKAYWDIIVIDECHNVAMRANDQGSSLRARLARLLSRRSDALILLSATPHDGSAKSFASLIHLLDRTVIPNPDSYTPADYRDKGLVVRRFKKDIRDQVGGDFQERVTDCLSAKASAAEETAYTALLNIPFTQTGKRLAGRGYELQRIGMQKALFSSPAAAIESTVARFKRLEAIDGPSDEVIREWEALEAFLEALRGIDRERFSKYRLLIETLALGTHQWSGTDPYDRIVLFSERIETLTWLQEHLAEDLKLKPNQIALLHGGLPDTDQQNLVDRFGRKDDPIRILLCSDVASEGLNLHYFCHRVVHFDMPWSLMTYLQRNGRVDRFGQTKQPRILYLQTEAQNEKIRGDQRILEVLQRKDEQANANLGDPLAFLDKYDAEQEAEVVAGFMSEGLSAAAVEHAMESIAAKSASNQLDHFNALMAALRQAPAAPAPAEEPHQTAKSRFSSHYAFAKSAIELLERRGSAIQWSASDATQTLTITAPRDLQVRLRQIPREAQRAPYVLCAEPARIMEEMEQARQAKAEDDTWPKIHYLWPQDPIFEWLADRIISEFRGHRAPVIRCPNVPPGEMTFIIAGTIPNRKGQPMVVEWQAVTRGAGGSFRMEAFDAFASRAGLAAGALANATRQVPAALQAALPDAVRQMRAHMVRAQREFAANTHAPFQKALEDLEKLWERQLAQLELDIASSGQPEQIRTARAAARKQEIEKDFQAYKGWVHDTMETEPEPFLQVIAAVCDAEME